MIRSTILGVALAILAAGPGMAQEQTRPAWTRFAKSDARFEPSPVRVGLPIATAFVAADGKVQPYPTQRADDVPGTTGTTRTRYCSALGGLKLPEAKRMAEAIARDEGVPSDLVAAILMIERRFDRSESKGQLPMARLTAGTRTGNEDCRPAVVLRAGIRRLKDLATRYSERLHLLAAYHAGEDALLAQAGVPTSPETLRFVAEVMNALAGGLARGVERRPAILPAQRTASFEAPPRAVRSKDTGDPRWASGFVLNLE